MIENQRLQYNFRKTWIRLLICTAAAILAVTGGIIRAFAAETQEEAYARALASKNQSQDPGSALLYPADETGAISALPEKRYTVMVYMIGSSDLSLLPDVENALSLLLSEMTRQLETGGYARFSRVRSAAKSFGLLEGSRGEEDYSYDLVDLGSLSEGLSQYYPSQCARLSSKLLSMVRYSCSNVGRSSGVTMYYPSRNGRQYTQMASAYQETAAPEGILRIPEDTDITDPYIPDSVAYIAETAFEYDMEETGEVDECGLEEYEPAYRFVIHCSRGSYAHQYALEYGIDFILEDAEKMDADTGAAQVTVLDTQTWEQACAALSTYQFLRTLLGGNLDFSRTSSWGQEHTYQIRWTLTTNGFRIDRSAAQLLENEQYCKEVLRCIMTYLPGSYDSADSGTQDDAQPYRWDAHISREMLLDILKDLSESESWKTQVEQYRQLGDEWLLECRQVDERADEDCRFHDPSCGFDTLLAIDSMLDVLAAFKAQEVPEEYFWLLRDLRAAEYTGMMEYYTGGREEEYLRTQHGRLLSMTPFSLKEAETFSPKGGFGGPSFSDMIVYIGDEKEKEGESE